jgi:hypothetical protein
MQPDDRGKRARTLGLGQISLYAVAPNEPARKEQSRGPFKLYTLRRSSQSVTYRSAYDAP